MQIPDRLSDAPETGDAIVCRCLRVRLSAIVDAIAVSEAGTVRELKCLTGAGDGCTACHPRLKALLQARRVEVQVAACVH